MQIVKTIGKEADAEWNIVADGLRTDDAVAVFDTEEGRVVAINPPDIIALQYPEAGVA